MGGGGGRVKGSGPLTGIGVRGGSNGGGGGNGTTGRISTGRPGSITTDTPGSISGGRIGTDRSECFSSSSTDFGS